jgi:hypothetical protein
VTTPGTHTVIFDLFDGVDASAPVSAHYTVVSAPVVLPVNASLGIIPVNSAHTIVLSISGSVERFVFEFRAEGASNWVTLGNATASPAELVLPAAAFVRSAGAHIVSIRGRTAEQMSAVATIWYVIGAAPPRPEISLAPHQTTPVRIRSTGLTAADRTVGLITRANVSYVRISASTTQGTFSATLGEFSPGPTTVIVPVEAFGTSGGITLAFDVWDGANHGAAKAQVTFTRNTRPTLTVTANWTLPIPPTGPKAAVPIDVKFTGSVLSALSYRIDAGIRINVSTPLRVSIPIDAFEGHLAWNRMHEILFTASDGIEEANASLSYSVRPPTGGAPPSIIVAATPVRFASAGPRRLERTFTVTLSDPEGGPLLVDFAVDEQIWSEPVVWGVGVQELEVPIDAFDGHLRPGPHTIAFRASDGTNSAKTSAHYVVNSPPILAIQQHEIILPGRIGVNVSDVDGDNTKILFRVDASSAWFNVPGADAFHSGAIELIVTSNWTHPPLEKGSHIFHFAAHDGFDMSETVEITVTFGAEVRTHTQSQHPAATEKPHAKANKISGGVIAGIGIGAAIVVGAVFVGVCFLCRRKSERDDYIVAESSVR